MTRPFLPLAALLATASALGAQTPAGTDFRVNTFTTDFQGFGEVAAEPDGDFIVAWSSIGQDGSGGGVFGQRFDAAGARRGGEFRVNSTTGDGQYVGGVAVRARGASLAAWSSDDQDGSGRGAFAQRYDGSGAAVGGEFQVNTHTTAAQTPYSVAMAPDGRFLIAWTSFHQDAYPGSAVLLRRYDSSGNAMGGEFQVNTYTISYQYDPAIAIGADGRFVVVWTSYGVDGSDYGIMAQPFDASGARVGSELLVNSYTTGRQKTAGVALGPDGGFVVVWDSVAQDGSGSGIFAQRFTATGARRGSEFRASTSTTGEQRSPSVAAEETGSFVVAWSHIGLDFHVAAQRFRADGSMRGAEFTVNAGSGIHFYPRVASDQVGNFVVVWNSGTGPGGDVSGRRFGGLLPAALGVDTPGGGGANGNNVLEPGEAVDIRPAWRNVNGAAQTFAGGLVSFTGPAATGVVYEIHDGTGSYGTVADGAIAACSDCYHVGVTFSGTRPAVHWDAVLGEQISPDAQGQHKPWSLHVGASFSDVPGSNIFYRFVETLLHHGVTGGCTAASYCPSTATTRDQMAVFVLVAQEGIGYAPPACVSGAEMFADVAASSPFCRWIEELARRGVVGGCGGGNYCPASPATRDQMAVFVLRTLDPTLVPPACVSGSEAFADVPFDSPFCRWIEELARRGVVAGCGGGNYCPTAAVTRDQMGVFISVTFGLTLYGP